MPTTTVTTDRPKRRTTRRLRFLEFKTEKTQTPSRVEILKTFQPLVAVGTVQNVEVRFFWCWWYYHPRPRRASTAANCEFYTFSPFPRASRYPPPNARENADKLWRKKTDICVYASERCRGHIALVSLVQHHKKNTVTPYATDAQEQASRLHNM